MTEYDVLPRKVEGFTTVKKLCRVDSSLVLVVIDWLGRATMPTRQPTGLEAAKELLSIEIYKVPCHFVDRIAVGRFMKKLDMCIFLLVSHHFVKVFSAPS